ncbi:MAG: pilus assembly protein [Planctomycetota bacterium]
MELGLVSFVLILIFAATIEFGRVVFVAQTLQEVARVMARELALTPLPPDTTFDDALPLVLDESALVIDLDATPDLDAYFATLPLANRLLRPLMIVDLVTIGGAPRRLLRYPGALIDVAPPSGTLGVAIPAVVARSEPEGHETLRWVGVVEEIEPGAFSAERMVGVRLNYPFQAAAMSGFRGAAFEPNIDRVNEADDASVVNDPETSPPEGSFIVDAGSGVGPYAGRYGLGLQYALSKEVRPFRRLVSGQSIRHREILTAGD